MAQVLAFREVEVGYGLMAYALYINVIDQGKGLLRGQECKQFVHEMWPDRCFIEFHLWTGQASEVFAVGGCHHRGWECIKYYLRLAGTLGSYRALPQAMMTPT
jgi:hypothetical protein